MSLPGERLGRTLPVPLGDKVRGNTSREAGALVWSREAPWDSLRQRGCVELGGAQFSGYFLN